MPSLLTGFPATRNSLIHKDYHDPCFNIRIQDRQYIRDEDNTIGFAVQQANNNKHVETEPIAVVIQACSCFTTRQPDPRR